MAYLIGTDEAGYAPNLGPLVITCTVWRIAKTPPDLDLYRRLQAVVCPDGNGAAGGPLLVADSKVVYSPARGLRLLERGVLAMMGLVDDVPRDWRTAWQMLDSEAAAHLDHLPWHREYDSALPHAADRDDVLSAAGRLREGLAAAGVELVSVRSTAVFPEPFNDGADRWGNKAEALSQWTLALVADALDGCQAEEVHVVCDKHGGRNRYGRLLQERFPEYLIEVHEESLAASTYRWGPDERRIEVRFCAGGESFLPVALASMVSKYLRELAMQAFNDFWCRQVPNLRPTAGYPGDAVRFKREIAKVQKRMGIKDRVLWRSR
ncbi:MAG TPA: hypothetical protein VHY91_25685 [Pirellulales bacterium]|jgi:ribonuclease HII|nr:hypothetical protein [Pirellulales bacterium]